ncbi:toll/interleukin-1 receptor domain-containing protein [Cereibacter johrii]|uniref:TIR domain-containing protein n=1 Tax=Cereibacter johrii TaxID=445629 RepID=A0ABX5J410_9RHOB|nr:toll/interleukin-1 receptor domain-containing protein [Cereibacter johrii]PTM77110.1 TIR domain-containing protein [Cereibacter johrii]
MNPTKDPHHRPQVLDLLRIHVIWANGSEEGARIAELLSKHFDGIGMERDGVAYRVPVRFASAPWIDASPLPALIDLSRAVHNAIVLLHDDVMQDDVEAWDDYVKRIREAISDRGNTDFIIPFGSPSGDAPLPTDAAASIQYTYRKAWAQAGMSASARDSRLLLHTLYQIRRQLALIGGGDGQEKIFVSHAKADGDTTASAIVTFVNDKSQDVTLHTFYDAKELNPGEDFSERFAEEIESGTLLAVVSDAYDSRPWCVFELTTAKRKRRPIVLADIGQRRTSRTYPYGANLPKVRIFPKPDDTSWIEPLLVETISEGLRCDLFERQAARVVRNSKSVLLLPRPPELFDVIDADKLSTLIVYPDPPLSSIEEEVLSKALARISPTTRLSTLGELS